MTAASYSDALALAYDRTTPDSVISAVKQVVINQIREFDSHVNIESTDFFNHTFAPDFVLHWEREKVVRQLFIRQDSGNPYFGDELARVSERSPIIFSLEPATGYMRVGKAGEKLARETNTLVTDAPALEEIVERRDASKVLDVASAVVLQGGRGVLDEERADVVATGIARGFVAASSLGVEETRQAISLINHFFRPGATARLTQFLQAVWIGAGGTRTSFPGSVLLERGLSVEALSFLLEVQSTQDLEFWRRVGVDLTIEKIVALNAESSPQLDLLINANLDRIQARACVVDDPTTRSLEEAESTWTRSNDELIWMGAGAQVRLAESKSAIEDPGTEDVHISLDEVIQRARQYSVPLESLEILTSNRKMSYGATTTSYIQQDITKDAQLQVLAATLGASAMVKRATASLPMGKTLVCDFDRRLGAGRSGAKFPVLDLLRYGVPLLTRLDVVDGQAIEELRRTIVELVEPPTLF